MCKNHPKGVRGFPIFTCVVSLLLLLCNTSPSSRIKLQSCVWIRKNLWEMSVLCGKAIITFLQCFQYETVIPFLQCVQYETVITFLQCVQYETVITFLLCVQYETALAKHTSPKEKPWDNSFRSIRFTHTHPTPPTQTFMTLWGQPYLNPNIWKMQNKNRVTWHLPPASRITSGIESSEVKKEKVFSNPLTYA